ncbi:cysteine hydrolase family protein [uncultured Rhodoblastus sp.]|uniref:cysteine hydrolase family protein n=1 Tax=uncultured Rhodoblastus sp. TaxID=543037 RepID=UPI0025D3E41F|nr:cysteine hydrolase family protein [uncultured Rhodoblastus sp.]
MSEPKSLMQLVGLPPAPGRFGDSALILIDCQREYTEGALVLDHIAAAVAEALRVLERAREKGAPVFHIDHHGPAGSPIFATEGPLVAIVPELAPRADEAVVVKALPNAFAGTGLAEKIRATGREEIIVVGFMTHMCVSTSVRAALEPGFRATVVAGVSPGSRADPAPRAGARASPPIPWRDRIQVRSGAGS